MADQHSVFDELAACAAELALLTTYNIDFATFEQVVLPRLRGGRARLVLLLMDAGMLAKACADPLTRPNLAGREYGLLPIRSPAAFHPKIVLRVGTKAARVLIGSHNLTTSGLGGNLEATTLFHAEEHASRDAARAAWSFARSWARYATLHRDDVEHLFALGERLVPWLSEPPAEEHPAVRFSRVEGPALWTDLRAALPEDTDAFVVTAPYFDADAAFLRALEAALPHAKGVVAVDPNIANLRPPGSALRSRITEIPASWRDKAGVAVGARVHAKLLWCHSPSGRHLLVSGSANASLAAWLAAPPHRNAEAVVLLRGSDADRAAEQLGLADAWTAPALGASAMEQMLENADESSSASPSVTLAARTAGPRLELDLTPPDAGAIVAANVWRRAEPFQPVPREAFRRGDGWEVDTSDIRGTVHFVEVTLDSGEVCRAPVHDAPSLQQHARTDSDLRMENLLNSLRSENPDVTDLLVLLDNVLRSRATDATSPSHTAAASDGRAGEQGKEHATATTLLVDDAAERSARHGAQSQSPLGDILAMLLASALGDRDHAQQDPRRDEDDEGSDDGELVGRRTANEAASGVVVAEIDDPERLRGVCHYYLERITTAFVERRQQGSPARFKAPTFADVEDAAAMLAVLDWLSGARLQDAEKRRIQGLVPGPAAARLLDSVVAGIVATPRGEFVAPERTTDQDALDHHLHIIRALSSRLLLRFGFDRDVQLRRLARGVDVEAMRRLAICAQAFTALAGDLEARELARQLTAKDGDAAAAADFGTVWEDPHALGLHLATALDAANSPLGSAAVQRGAFAAFPIKERRALVVVSHLEGNKAKVVRADIANAGQLTLLADRVQGLTM